MDLIGRKHVLVNLDPAIGGKEALPYEPKIDIRELVTSEAVMERFQLGPNGALMYCMEYLLENVDWLERELLCLCRDGEDDVNRDRTSEKEQNENVHDKSEASSLVNYIIIDMPGQVELYAHHHATREILCRLTGRNQDRLLPELRAVVVNLIDSQYCIDLNKFLSASLIVLMTMLNMGLPHVNALTKSDWFQAEYDRYAVDLSRHSEPVKGEPAATHETEHLPAPRGLCALDVFAEAEDFLMLVPEETPDAALSRAIAELLNDYGLVRFLPISVLEPSSIIKVLQEADRACGYCYLEHDVANILSSRDMTSTMDPQVPH
jgi:GTPase SAR1 family protein